MNRIDFLGAHGIGKSTIYQHLLKRRTEPRWLTRMEAKRKITTEFVLDDRSPRDLAKAVSCHLPRLGDIFVNAYALRPAEQALARDRGQHSEFFEYCLLRDLKEGLVSSVDTGQTTVDTSRTSLNYVNLSWLFDRLSELCLMEELDETVVFDESLSHTTTGLLVENASDLTVRTYFDTMPRPDTVIHVHAPATTVVDRIAARAKTRRTTLRHQQVDLPALRKSTRQALRIAQLGACTLQWRGARLLCVDATAPPEENAARIDEFIRD